MLCQTERERETFWRLALQFHQIICLNCCNKWNDPCKFSAVANLINFAVIVVVPFLTLTLAVLPCFRNVYLEMCMHLSVTANWLNSLFHIMIVRVRVRVRVRLHIHHRLYALSLVFLSFCTKIEWKHFSTITHSWDNAGAVASTLAMATLAFKINYSILLLDLLFWVRVRMYAWAFIRSFLPFVVVCLRALPQCKRCAKH